MKLTGNRRKSGWLIAVFGYCTLLLAGCGAASDSTPMSAHEASSSGWSSIGSGGSSGGNSGGGENSGTGTVTVQWDAPTVNTDSSCLASLEGFIVSYGTTSGNYTRHITLPLAGLTCVDSETSTGCGVVQTCTYQVTGLGIGQWYFSATAYDSNLSTSPASNEATATVN